MSRSAAAAAAAVVLALGAAAQGDWSRACDQPGFGVAGRVFALGTWRNELVAGTYRKLFKDGSNLNHIAHFDGERWLPFGTGLDGPPRAILESGGDLWVGGEFRNAGGAPAGHVARFDGTRWHAVGEGFDGIVWALAAHGGEIYAGGSFTASGSRPVSRIARWDGTRWQPVGGGMTWNLGMYASVRCLLSTGTRLYAGGEFDRAGPVAASHVAYWDGSAWHDLAGGINSFRWGTVWSLASYRGRVHVGGTFGQAGTLLADNIAAFDGSAWSAVGPGVQGGGSTVESLAVYGGDLYLAGSFIQAGTLGVHRIVRWDGAQFHALGGVSDAEAQPPTIIATTVWNGRLYCGGEFQTAGLAFGIGGALGVYHIASFDGAGWASVGPGLGFDAGVRMLRRWRGQTVAGGRFLIAGGNYATGLAAFDGRDWRPLGLFDGIVHDAVEHQGDLYVAGEFRTGGGLSANGVARYDGTSWSTLGSGPGLHGAYSIAVYQGMIHVGTVGNPRRWNGASWEDFTPQIFGVISVLHVHNGLLYLGGSTPFMPGAPNLFSWDGATLNAVGGGTDDAVTALVSFGPHLLAGGRFRTAGSVPARCLARWDGSQWWAFGAGVQGASVEAIALFGGQVYVGGDFSRFQGENAEYLARWDGSRWQSLPGGDPDSVVTTLLPDEARGELHVGGGFSRTGATDSDSYAVWQRTPTWTDVGHALRSARRAPILSGEGTLQHGAFTHLAVSSMLEHTPLVLVLSTRRVDVPALGGTLVPLPSFFLAGGTSPIGTFVLDFPWPVLEPRTELYLQAWAYDPLGPQQATATNGLWLQVP